MASSDMVRVMEELREQRERGERQWKLTLREHRLNRRAYEEGIALCARLVEVIERLAREIDANTKETRAQTAAIFKLIDRMDRLDGGSAPA